MRIIFLLILMVIFSSAFCQTQAEMNQEAADSFELADKQLNEIYDSIVSEYSTDTIFIKNLEISQAIWIAFRDAELNMKYPEREPGWYGSLQPMCETGYLEKLTRDRIKTLNEWLEGIDLDEGCGGSIKNK